jgi:hypothetical protein
MKADFQRAAKVVLGLVKTEKISSSEDSMI